jgi:hypothetical protein
VVPTRSGDEGVVAPVGEQLGLLTHQAGAAHEQPVTLVAGLGDLRGAAIGIDDVCPGVLWNGGDHGPDRLGLADGDGVADLVAAAGADGLGRPEPRVGADGQLAAGAGAAHPGGQFVDEAGGAAGGVGPPGALAGVQDLAGVGAGGQQRMVPEGVGVAVGGALLVVAVDLAHRGVQVHGHRPITGAWAGRPRPLESLLGKPVELAHVPEGEGAQERAERGGRHDPVAQQAGGLPAAQQVGVVDAVGTRQHRVDQGQQLAPRMGGASPLTQSIT